MISLNFLLENIYIVDLTILVSRDLELRRVK